MAHEQRKESLASDCAMRPRKDCETGAREAEHEEKALPKVGEWNDNLSPVALPLCGVYGKGAV